MASIYKASYVSLHVRQSNKAAIALYRDSLGFEVIKTEKKYCMLLLRFLHTSQLIVLKTEMARMLYL